MSHERNEMRAFFLAVSGFVADLVVRGIEAFWYTFCVVSGIAFGCAAFYPFARFAWSIFKHWAAKDLLNAANP